MEDVQCFSCVGIGCDECGYVGYFCSPTFSSPTCMSTGNLMTGSSYSNQAHISSNEESPFDWQTPHRAHTYPPTTMPTNNHNPPPFASSAPQHSHMYHPTTMTTSYHSLPSSSSPTPQRSHTFDATTLSENHHNLHHSCPSMPQRSVTYPLVAVPTTYYNPPNDGSYDAICMASQSQPVRSTLPHVAQTLQCHQAHPDTALIPGYQNQSGVGVSKIVQPVPQRQSNGRTFYNLAPKPDGNSRDHNSNGDDDQSLSHAPNTPWWCAPCKRKFANAGNLNRHNEHHCNDKKRCTDQKRYSCDECGASLSRFDLLTKHAKQKHKDTKCDICPKVFKGKHALSKHKREEHDVSGDGSPGL
jgi:hypothetical protein